MFAIWFLFDKNDEEYIHHIILNLSKKYKSTVFLPHLTVYGLIEIPLEVIDRIVFKIIKDVKPFSIEKIGINYSDDLWKSLFIEIKQNQYLNKINKKLTNELFKFSKYEFLPHVSLIYKKMSEKEKEQLANDLNIKNSFLISKIGILHFSEKILDWKIVREYNF
jgi:2'-5' RNA ligase